MAKPIVDGIEKDLEGRAKVVRLGVMSGVGSQAARRYGVRGVPTLLVFDGAGQVVDQSVGIPDREAIVARVERLLN
jgi:thioredoxin-like negative regulator of GroEL